MGRFTQTLLLSAALWAPGAAIAASPQISEALTMPKPGVICDRYICANGQDGVSVALTMHYLGKKAAARLTSFGEFNREAFTFANGVHCDIQARQCLKDRYSGADGQPSGEIDHDATRQLFVY